MHIGFAWNCCIRVKVWQLFKMENVKASFRRMDKVLFATLISRLLVTSIYTTVRVYIIGNVEQDNAVKIISQLQWMNCILEILEEGLLQPLYHCFGESVSQDNLGLQSKVRSGMLVSTIFYSVFCAISGICAPQLVEFMDQKDTATDETVAYLRIELCGILLKGVTRVFNIVLVLKKQSSHLILLLFSQLFCSIIFDLFFFS